VFLHETEYAEQHTQKLLFCVLIPIHASVGASPLHQYVQDLLEGYSGVEAHLLGQIYKYSMRLGKKDSKEQDATKISWYAQCLANYYRTGRVETGWK
jgi:hypothetical protein